MTLQERIQAACDSTPPKTRERNEALAQIRWALRDPNGNYAGLDSHAQIIAVSDVKDAQVFDGRDNEQLKRDFYSRITGMDYTVELL